MNKWETKGSACSAHMSPRVQDAETEERRQVQEQPVLHSEFQLVRARE